MSYFWTKIRDSIWDRNEVSITDLGQFCGPNWTNGEFNPGSGSPVDPNHPPENYKIRDALYDVDAACKVHDTAYDEIQNSDESEAYKAKEKYKADKELLEDWSQVDSSELSWAEKAYLALGKEYNEDGSGVSGVGKHVGHVSEIDAVSDTGMVVGVLLLFSLATQRKGLLDIKPKKAA